jgi:PPOX class probable F420-dependent enzyme
VSTYKYCQLVTFRRSGDRGATPVWFAVAGHRLYVKTEAPSGKVRRIRANAHVEVAPARSADARAAGVAGARASSIPPEEPAAERALRARYGVGRPIVRAPRRAGVPASRAPPHLLEISPRGHAA